MPAADRPAGDGKAQAAEENCGRFGNRHSGNHHSGNHHKLERALLEVG